MEDGVTIEVEGNVMRIVRGNKTLTIDQRERRPNEVREIELMYRVFDLPGVRQHGTYRERLDSALEVVGKIINPPPPDRDSPEGRALRVDARTKVDLADADKVEAYRVEAWVEHYAKAGEYEKSDAIWKTWSSQADRFELTDDKLVPAEGWPTGITAEAYIRKEHTEADKRAHEVAPEDDVEVEPEPKDVDPPAEPEPEPEPAPGETAALLEAALKGST